MTVTEFHRCCHQCQRGRPCLGIAKSFRRRQKPGRPCRITKYGVKQGVERRRGWGTVNRLKNCRHGHPCQLPCRCHRSGRGAGTLVVPWRERKDGGAAEDLEEEWWL